MNASLLIRFWEFILVWIILFKITWRWNWVCWAFYEREFDDSGENLSWSELFCSHACSINARSCRKHDDGPISYKILILASLVNETLSVLYIKLWLLLYYGWKQMKVINTFCYIDLSIDLSTCFSLWQVNLPRYSITLSSTPVPSYSQDLFSVDSSWFLS